MSARSSFLCLAWTFSAVKTGRLQDEGKGFFDCLRGDETRRCGFILLILIVIGNFPPQIIGANNEEIMASSARRARRRKNQLAARSTHYGGCLSTPVTPRRLLSAVIAGAAPAADTEMLRLRSGCFLTRDHFPLRDAPERLQARLRPRRRVAAVYEASMCPCCLSVFLSVRLSPTCLSGWLGCCWSSSSSRETVRLSGYARGGIAAPSGAAAGLRGRGGGRGAPEGVRGRL